MGTSANQARYADPVVLQASAAKTATYQTAAQSVSEHGVLRLTLAVTAFAGTSPTLDVVVETSSDGTGAGVGAWRSLGAFAQKVGAVASERKSFAGADHFVRLNATIGGSAGQSLTFSVQGSGV